MPSPTPLGHMTNILGMPSLTPPHTWHHPTKGHHPQAFQSIHIHFKSPVCMAPKPSLTQGIPTFAWFSTPRHPPSFMAACYYKVISPLILLPANRPRMDKKKMVCKIFSAHACLMGTDIWHWAGLIFSCRDKVITIYSTIHRGRILTACLCIWLASFDWILGGFGEMVYCAHKKGGKLAALFLSVEAGLLRMESLDPWGDWAL